MATSTVYVYFASGSPKSGARVVLSFDHGGVSDAFLTDRNGKAVIDHSTTGRAKVIVDGTTKLTDRFPGTATVNV